MGAMSVTIGISTVDGATGTPHPPLSEAALKAYADTAAAFRYKGTAPTAEGQMMVWHDCTELGAQQKLRELGSMVGYVVTVAYPHGSIVGVCVSNVQGEWQAKAGTVNGGVMVARVTFDRKSDKESGDEVRSLVIVQTASALAGPWTTRDKWASLKGSDGTGTYAGEAIATHVGAPPDTTQIGKWVRMVWKTAVDPDNPTAAEIDWVGVIIGASASARRDPAKGIGWGAEAVYRCAGIAHVFAQLVPFSWWEMQEAGTTPLPFQGALPQTTTFTDVGRPIDYNADGIGNASNNDVQLDAAPAPKVFLHARGIGTAGQNFTAYMALQNAIAQVRRREPTLPPIVVDATYAGASPGDKLFYVEQFPVGKQSLLGIIDTIVNSDNQRTFRFVVDWAASPVAIKIVVTDATVGEPEANVVALDLTGETVASWSCDYDGGTVRDTWGLDAGDRSFVMTVAMFPTDTVDGFQRGFSLAQQTAWEAAPATAPAQLRNNNDLVHVWRQFALSPKWTGVGATGVQVMPYERTIVAGEETGELETGNGLYPTGIFAWKFDRAMPLGEGFDWTTPVVPPSGGAGGIVTRSGPTTGPLVWWRKSGQPLDQIHDDYQFDYGDATASILIGRTAEEAAAIKAKMVTDGYEIWATVSFIHPKTWRCTAKIAPARTDAPRMGITYLPASMYNRTDLLGGTVLSVDGSGTPIYGTPGRRDGAGSITALRDKHKTFVQTSSATIEWQLRDATLTTPTVGAVVTQAKVITETSPLTESTLAMRVVIARRTRSWDAYNPYTHWTANPIVPNLGGNNAAVIAAGKGPAILNRAYKDVPGNNNV
jgi:hypothetical protein